MTDGSRHVQIRDFPGCLSPSPPFGSLLKNPTSGPSATVTSEVKIKHSNNISKTVECKSAKVASKKGNSDRQEKRYACK